jgi:hypothetical protein
MAKYEAGAEMVRDFTPHVSAAATGITSSARANAPDYGLADAVDALVAFDLEAVATQIDELRPAAL